MTLQELQTILDSVFYNNPTLLFSGLEHLREKRLDVEVAIHADKIEFVFDTGKAILKDVYTLDNSTSLQDAEKRFSEKLLGMLLSHGLLAWENAAKVPNDV